MIRTSKLCSDCVQIVLYSSRSIQALVYLINQPSQYTRRSCVVNCTLITHIMNKIYLIIKFWTLIVFKMIYNVSESIQCRKVHNGLLWLYYDKGLGSLLDNTSSCLCYMFMWKWSNIIWCALTYGAISWKAGDKRICSRTKLELPPIFVPQLRTVGYRR